MVPCKIVQAVFCPWLLSCVFLIGLLEVFHLGHFTSNYYCLGVSIKGFVQATRTNIKKFNRKIEITTQHEMNLENMANIT